MREGRYVSVNKLNKGDREIKNIAQACKVVGTCEFLNFYFIFWWYWE